MGQVMEWTRSLSYKPYNQWSKSYHRELISEIQNSEWKLAFHILPETGLLNDPNGFSYYNGEWHLFYQAYPFGPVHGVKSWYHMTSKNLVDWKQNDYVLLPDSDYDSHGAYSGSALSVDDKLFIMYTGNVRNDHWERHSYQLGAWLNQDMQLKKFDDPLIPEPPAGYTHEFRDPQVFRYQDEYLMIIGAQTEDKKGAVLTYQSPDLMNWHCIGELDYTKEEMGFMVECPNLLFIDEQPVLLFCPQGLDKNIKPYQNIFPNTYVIGSSFDRENTKINDVSDLVHLDEGFDLYATQAFNAPDGRVLSVGWVGLPEINYPSFEEEWAHCLSIVKELTIQDNHLYQTPVSEMKDLRRSETDLNGKISEEQNQLVYKADENIYELLLELDTEASGTLTLFADKTNSSGLKLSYDADNHTITMDRSRAGISFGEEYGTTRSAEIRPEDKLKLHIFVDRSVCEVFINDGYRVMTSRVFLENADDTHVFLEGFKGAFSGNVWELRKMNE
ncbi:sucrose-6-phosphate hydrolase [Corticicoccus populi]|uniref:Sucrose-6-phosphate hydrolase n=1 Tax=Corticicoccus populi TaxID=1812821 RepID=A0ABW5WVW8_9STAP